jgi:hypothetical protein
MKQEHWLAVVVGFIIFAYILDSLTNPLRILLPTPYHYFTLSMLSLYPFTATSILLKAFAILISSLLVLSFTGFSKLVKGIALLVVSGLLQLYSLQDVATRSYLVPLEWSLSFTLSGIFLLLPTIIFIVLGILEKIHKAVVYGDEDDFTLSR